MKQTRGSAAAHHRGRQHDETDIAAAEERVRALFERVDRLTPDELGRIGLVGHDPVERRRLLDEVDAIARRTGRLALLDDVVTTAREALLARIGSGTFNPTWVTLNWGLSSGTTESRVAIIEAVEDAAAAAVIEDVADPDLIEALSLDAARVTAMATGAASDGALARAVAGPPSGEYRASPVRWIAIVFAAGSVGWIAAGIAGSILGEGAALVAFAIAALVVGGLAVRFSRRAPAAPEAVEA